MWLPRKRKKETSKDKPIAASHAAKVSTIINIYIDSYLLINENTIKTILINIIPSRIINELKIYFLLNK